MKGSQLTAPKSDPRCQILTVASDDGTVKLPPDEAVADADREWGWQYISSASQRSAQQAGLAKRVSPHVF